MTEQTTTAPRGGIFSFWTGLSLWKKILIALVAGLALGILAPSVGVAIKPIGTIFLNGIKMLVVPLIFITLVAGMIAMDDPKKMGRVGLKSIIVYMLTTGVAITIGLIIGALLQPGAGIGLESATVVEAKEAPSLIDTLVGLIPTNPIEALASGNVLQIIVFALVLGIAINMTGALGKPVRDLFEASAEVMFNLTHIVISFAPYGVFALMAWVAGEYGLDLLIPLIWVVVAVYLACIIHVVLVYGGAILLLARLGPWTFFKGIVEAQMVAFTTTSSSGTLPVTMSCTQENLGVSRNISSFVLPLGATINMDGTALYQGVCALFVAQAYGIDLTMGNYVTIILTSTLASIGTAGVPGAGLIMLSLVLTSVGLPLDGVAIIAGIDRILDMARTAVNVTGDAMVSVLVAKSEGELDENIYGKQPV